LAARQPHLGAPASSARRLRPYAGRPRLRLGCCRGVKRPWRDAHRCADRRALPWYGRLLHCPSLMPSPRQVGAWRSRRALTPEVHDLLEGGRGGTRPPSSTAHQRALRTPATTQSPWTHARETEFAVPTGGSSPRHRRSWPGRTSRSCSRPGPGNMIFIGNGDTAACHHPAYDSTMRQSPLILDAAGGTWPSTHRARGRGRARPRNTISDEIWVPDRTRLLVSCTLTSGRSASYPLCDRVLHCWKVSSNAWVRGHDCPRCRIGRLAPTGSGCSRCFTATLDGR